MSKDNRIRINKKMVAWSNGERTNIVPSEWKKVDDYGRTMRNYHCSLREGDENYLSCTIIREECQCREYEADRAWEQGRHLEALNEMMRAALWVLPDESVGYEFEDAQWLNPWESLYWHPNIQEFLRYNRRCEDYCKRDTRLWPVLEDSLTYQNYRRYLRDLGHWVHDC
ncbi:MAG: hypothetical protein IK126_06240 [Bacteroidales bacterium]|nr:hypothetical protein [Bacteroidales bacterium]